MVADGDVKGVTACDVVSQRLPVHCDQPGPGLSDLQPLWSPHWFCKEAESCKGKAWSTGLRGIRASKSFQFHSHFSDATPYGGLSQHCSSFRGVIYSISVHRPGIYLKRLITADQLHLHPHWLLLSPFTLTHYISVTLHPLCLPILVSRATEVRAHLTLRVTPAAVATNQPELATPSEREL